MLTGITLENFKAFKEPQFIPIKPITLVFGQNNAGKSSIIHALAFLKHVHDTNGDCNPGRMDYGWSNLDLGSWKNLVFGQDENASMMIRLETKNNAIRWSFEKARVVSFEIEEKIGDDWIATAKGKNIGVKGIMWQIELHSSHSLWKQYREALWDRVIGRVSFRDLVDKHGVHFREPVFDDEAGQKYTQEHREKFEKHFGRWLHADDTWKAPPLSCEPKYADTTDIPFQGLFPRQPIPNRSLNQTKGSKKTERAAPVFYDSGRVPPEHLTRDNLDRTFTDEVLESFREKLHEAALTPEESQNLFSDLHAGGGIWTIEDALHVDALLSSFVSHLHLDAQRFPPNGILSRNRLSPRKPADQPWIRLLDDDYKHHFYSEFCCDVDHLKSAFKFSEEICEEIKKSLENHDLPHDLPAKLTGILQRLVDAHVDRSGIQELRDRFKELLAKAKLGDIPPILAANHALLQLGIQYSLEMRKRVEKTYPPNIDPRRGDEVLGDEVSANWDTELVFKGKSGVHTLHNLGSGVRVIVPVIVALTSAEVGLLSIEEPECHVHPKLQTELGDLLIQRLGWTYYDAPEDDPDAHPLAPPPRRSDKEHRRKSYTLVETHSEHLILRILRRIRETTRGKLPEDALPVKTVDISVLYVHQHPNEAAVVKELRVNDQGRFIDDWPEGFFEDRLGELI